MKKTELLGMFLTFLFIGGMTACNSDDEGFSKEQEQRALFQMKGNYTGVLQARLTETSEKETFEDVKVKSEDSLSFMLPLSPMAVFIDDEKVTEALYELGSVEWKAGYEFTQIDGEETTIHFILHPKNIVIPAVGDVPEIVLCFSEIYGGTYTTPAWTSFNVSPEEIRIGSTSTSISREMVYHFEGSAVD